MVPRPGIEPGTRGFSPPFLLKTNNLNLKNFYHLIVLQKLLVSVIYLDLASVLIAITLNAS